MRAFNNNGQVTCLALMIDSPAPGPHNSLAQLESATLAVAGVLGIPAIARIGYGTPAYTAFGLGKRQAKQHPYFAILCLSGKELLAAQQKGQFVCRNELTATKQKQ